jgi:hypothetical protein
MVSTMAVGAQERDAASRVGPQAQAPDPSDTGRWATQILLMQAALELAVRNGASDLLTQMSRVTQAPPEAQLIGPPQAQGFRIPEYGMFFHVRVPGMSGTVLYALPFLIEVDQRRQSQRLVSQAGGTSDAAAAPPVSPLDAPTSRVVLDPSGRQVQLSQADLDVLRDPDSHYVGAIRGAIIDSMLEDSRALRISADEYLTIAARTDSRLNPLDPSERLRTMTFSVKGIDLTAFHQGRLTLDEARQLVTVSTD